MGVDSGVVFSILRVKMSKSSGPRVGLLLTPLIKTAARGGVARRFCSSSGRCRLFLVAGVFCLADQSFSAGRTRQVVAGVMSVSHL
jgi:hypothetical protein